MPNPGLTPAQRTLRARMAAHASHARNDGRERTAPARRAFLERFYDQVDPDRTLDPAERERRAEQAKRAYFAGLALKSSKARQRRRPEVSTDDAA